MPDTCRPSIEPILMMREQSCASNGADIDDAGAVVGGGRGLQELDQALADEEDRLEVQVDHLVPAFLGEFVEGLAPAGTCIVDENVDLLLALLDFFREE